MKFIFIIGNAAVGKMTVGQELCKITDLCLFHNHMVIEPVLEVFGEFHLQTIKEMREVVFRNFAKTDNYGLVFTMMMDFSRQSNWDYLESIKDIFKPYGTDFYYIELVARQDIRLKRNVTENRLKNKPSKKNIEESTRRLLKDDANQRLESYPGEFPFENYIKIDNSEKEAKDVAIIIKSTFDL